MGRLRSILFALVIVLLAVGPSWGDERVREIQDLLMQVSEELAEQLDVLAQQEEQGLTEQAAGTSGRIVALIAKQRMLLSHLEQALSGKPAPEPEAPLPQPTPDDELEVAIDSGLSWLAAHQNEEGFWHPLRYWEELGPETIDGLGNAGYTVGVTGLVLLAFLEDGHTYRKGEHKKTVREGFRYLKEMQDPEGCFGTREKKHFVYNHAIATLAMIRHYQATRVVGYKRSAEAGVEFILKARNPGAAWRYGIRPKDNDSSVTGWMMAALGAAREAGFKVEEAALREPREWLDRITNPKTGKVGYDQRDTGPARPSDMVRRFPPEASAANTASANAARLNAGVDPAESAFFQKGLAYQLARLPSPVPNAVDTYYWYWGTQVAARVGGQTLRTWSEPMRELLLSRQRQEGRTRGSWDPDGPWSLDGGRVYQTAVMVLIAEEMAGR